MLQNWYRQNGIAILQTQNTCRSDLEHCVHKNELTNHVNTAVNSYAPIRCLRIGAFYIGPRENFSSVMVADLGFCVFHRLKGEKQHLAPIGHEGRRVK